MVHLFRHRHLPSPSHAGLRSTLDESFWNRFWDEYWGSIESPLRTLSEATAEWTPDVDVSETDKEVVMEANIAGYDPKKITVEIEDNVLTMKGEHAEEKEEKKRRYYRKERRSGAFFRQVALPPVDETKARCRARNGTLTITLPKKHVPETESKAHKLAIES